MVEQLPESQTEILHQIGHDDFGTTAGGSWTVELLAEGGDEKSMFVLWKERRT